jgi:hypothetical protein
MDEIIKQILTTGGPLAVLVVVVWIFTTQMREISKDHREWLSANMDGFKRAIEQNTAATRELAQSVRMCPLKRDGQHEYSEARV